MEIYLDIETIPCQKPGIKEELAAGIQPPANYSKPETIAKWEQETKPGLVEEKWRETALNGALGQIYCIGYAVNTATVNILHDLDEKDLLKRFKLSIENQYIKNIYGERRSFQEDRFVYAPASFIKNHRWIGHNIRDFDLRFLFHRCVVHGIKPFFPIDPKPIGDYCYDTMIGWAGYGGKINLDRLCSALDIKSDDDLKGSEVWDAIGRGEHDRVMKHCESDVEKARKIYKRINFLGD